MYTASQTYNLLLRYTLALKWDFQIKTKSNLDKTINLLLNHEYLKLKGLKYKLVRLYMSTYSMNQYVKNKEVLLPFDIITNKELIPTFQESIIEQPNEDSIIDYLIICMFLNLGYPSTTCSYFDYKIADIASTTAFPLLSGYIPSSNLINKFLSMDNVDDMIYEELRTIQYSDKNSLIKEFIKRIKPDGESEIKFINFVDNCSPKNDFVHKLRNDEIGFQEKHGIFQEEKDINNDEINDCPKPFYKQVRLFGRRKKRTSKVKKSYVRKRSRKRKSKKRII